jgi:uncharacterized membrane protein
MSNQMRQSLRTISFFLYIAAVLMLLMSLSHAAPKGTLVTDANLRELETRILSGVVGGITLILALSLTLFRIMNTPEPVHEASESDLKEPE